MKTIDWGLHGGNVSVFERRVGHNFQGGKV